MFRLRRVLALMAVSAVSFAQTPQQMPAPKESLPAIEHDSTRNRGEHSSSCPYCGGVANPGYKACFRYRPALEDKQTSDFDGGLMILPRGKDVSGF
ncbi:hypothetical protein R80B4_03268 [Fibrobacteres bacterium R8-0-B4]